MDGVLGFHFQSVFCNPFKGFFRVFYGSGLMLSSFFGLLGSICQLLLWKSYLKKHDVRHKPSSNPHIVFNLAVCNALSCITSIMLGLILLLSQKSYENGMISAEIAPSEIDGMLVITVLCDFGYIASAFWTLMYFVDVCSQVHKTNCWLMFHYLPSWGLATLFTVLIEVIRFAKTDSLRKCSSSKDVLGSVIVWASVVVMVMLLLTIFLYAIDRQVKKNIGLVCNIYTTSQRNLMQRVRKKFVLFLVIFAICWLPTLTIGILQLTDHRPMTQEVLCYVEALLHPLQGTFNYFIFTPQRSGQSLQAYGGDRNSPTASQRIKQQYFDASYESSVSANMAYAPILQSVSSFHFTPCFPEFESSSVRTHHSTDTLDFAGNNYGTSLENSLVIGRLLGENATLYG